MYSGGFYTLVRLCFFTITMIYFIINVNIHPATHSALMETSEYFIFDEICACIDLLGNISKYNSLSIVDLIICPSRHFVFIISLVGRTIFRWANTAMKFPVHPESATAAFSCSVSFQIFVLGA